MNEQSNITQRASRGALAVLAAGMLVTGAAWHSLEAQSTAKPATITTPITHAIAGGRERPLSATCEPAPAPSARARVAPASEPRATPATGGTT